MHESTNQPDNSAVDSLTELFFEIREHVEKVSARVRMAKATRHPLDVVRARRYMAVGSAALEAAEELEEGYHDGDARMIRSLRVVAAGLLTAIGACTTLYATENGEMPADGVNSEALPVAVQAVARELAEWGNPESFAAIALRLAEFAPATDSQAG